jgi:predicted MFS family arabinose efflux permease
LSHSHQSWLILIIVNGVYFFVYFHRVSPAVLAPSLLEAFSASATSLGVMSSAYFYPYALSQPLVGMLADRWGARIVVTLFTLIAFLGALSFGLAPTLLLASIARALIGFGAAGVFVPALKVLLPWFGPGAFAQMNAILLAVGNFGAIVASTPYAWFIQEIGWRSSFFFIAGISLLLAILSFVWIKDQPPDSHPQREEKKETRRFPPGKDWRIFKTPFFWTMAILFFVYGGPFTTFQGLWGYPFLIDVYKYDKIQASNLLMVIAFGAILGGPLLVYLTGKIFPENKHLWLSLCIAAQTLNWFCIAFIGSSLNYFSLSLLFFGMGTVMATTLSLVWSIIREVSPAERLGTVMGWINPAPFLGIAIFQPVTGYLMDRVGKIEGAFPLQAYQNAFTLCLSAVFIAFMLSLLLPRMRKSL